MQHTNVGVLQLKNLMFNIGDFLRIIIIIILEGDYEYPEVGTISYLGATTPVV